MINQHHTRILLGAIAALGLSAPSAFAAPYALTFSSGTAAQDWNTPATWGGSGTPGSAAGDTATLSGDFNGVAQTVNISAALSSGLTALTLGDTNVAPSATTVSASSGFGLSLASGATLTSAGTTGAVNTISAPVSLAGGLTFGTSANPLAISGTITTAAAGTITNSSGRTLTLGNINAAAGTLTLDAGGTGAATANSNFILNGVIADGGVTATNLSLGARPPGTAGATASGTIRINANNTYTGNTVLGRQANNVTLFQINSDQPFGTAGSLTIGNSSYLNRLEAVTSDRSITKSSMTINKSIGFQGSNSLTLAGTTITMSGTPSTGNVTLGNVAWITNEITAPGKSVTLGTVGGNLYLNNNATDLFRVRDVAGAGTTVILSNVGDNNPNPNAVPPTPVTVNSKLGFSLTGTGTLILAGTNTYQGGTRISSTGTVQIGNGGTTGSMVSGNGLTPVVTGTGAGTLAFNRSDAVATTVTANGPIGIYQKGSGALTLSNSQFNSGANVVGDGVTASKLIVSGSAVAASNTSAAATVVAATGGTAATVTLTNGDTVSGLNLKVGQPVNVTGNNTTSSYIHQIVSESQIVVYGTTLIPLTSNLLSFGAGSALGTSAATTTVNNLSTLAGTGTISGGVSVATGGRLAPGVNTVDSDFSGRFNFGDAKTLTTGALSLTGAKLDFDLASTAAGVSDYISSTGAVSFDSFSFNFSALTTGVLEVGAVYNLLGSVGGFTGDTGLISTVFSNDLAGQYSPAYSVNSNVLQVVFSAIPEPSSFGFLAGMFALGGGFLRRRRQARS